MENVSAITSYLAEVRHRLLLTYITRNIGLYCAFLATVFLAFLLLDALVDYSATMRLLGGTLLLTSILGPGLHTLILVHRFADDVMVARHVGMQHPQLSSDLISVVELHEEESTTRGHHSPDLLQALAAQTWEALKPITPSMIVPTRLLMPAGVGVSVVLVIWLITALSWPSAVSRGLDRFFSLARFDEGKIADQSLVGALRVVYHYPEYTGRAPRTVEGVTGDLVGPVGTTVEIQAPTFLPGPIASAAVSVKWQDESQKSLLPLTLRDDQKEIHGRFTLRTEGTYRFMFRTAEEKQLLDPLLHRLSLEADLPPKLRLYGPTDYLAVTPRHYLEIGYAAEDDYGLAQVTMLYQIDQQMPRRLTLWSAKKNETQRNLVSKYDWDLNNLDLRAGMVISYWLEATDNNSINGSQATRSAPLHIKIFDAEAEHEKLLSQQQGLLEQGLRLLADRLQSGEETNVTAPDIYLDKILAQQNAQSSFVDALREIRNRLRQDRLATRSTISAISNVQISLEEKVTSETAQLKALEAARRKKPLRPAQLVSLVNASDEVVTAFEQSVLQLALLLDEQRLQLLMIKQRSLEETAARIDQLLAAYRQRPTNQLRQDLERELLRFQKKVAQLLEQSASLRSLIPHEYLNFQAIAALNLPTNAVRLTQMLRQGKIDELQTALNALRQQVSQLDQLLANNLDQYREKRLQGEHSYASALQSYLRQWEKRQRQLLDQTGQITGNYRQHVAQLLRAKIIPFIRQELVKLAALTRQVQEITIDGKNSYLLEQHERVKARLVELKGTFDSGDLDSSLQLIRRAYNGLQVLEDDLAEDVEGQYGERRQRAELAMRRAAASRRQAETILKDLEMIFPSPQAMYSPADRQTLRRIEKQQLALKQDLHNFMANENVAKREAIIGGANNSTPVRGLKTATEMMQHAAGSLHQGTPQEAQGLQADAAEQLRQLQQQLKMAQLPQQFAQPTLQVMREKVVIPEAETWQPPKEFREEIIEAMKEKVPRQYRRPVKEYYEELVK